MKLPDIFIRDVLNTYGIKGQQWLDQLPTLTAYFVDRWQLKNLTLSENLSCNYVVFAYSSTYMMDVVLKMGASDIGFLREQKALQYYAGHGCVTLLDYDTEKNGMLLEAIKPGISLNTLFPHDDTQAVTCAIGVIQKLHTRPFSDTRQDYQTIEQWLRLLDHFSHEHISVERIQKARALAHRLLPTQQEPYLLHGDLHYGNILLSSKNSWTAIDPKGVVGELAYEVGALIRNPWPELFNQQNPQEITHRRFDLFSKQLGIDKQRTIDWSYVQAVLATCEALEDGVEYWKYATRCAELIEKDVSF